MAMNDERTLGNKVAGAADAPDEKTKDMNVSLGTWGYGSVSPSWGSDTDTYYYGVLSPGKYKISVNIAQWDTTQDTSLVGSINSIYIDSGLGNDVSYTSNVKYAYFTLEQYDEIWLSLSDDKQYDQYKFKIEKVAGPSTNATSESSYTLQSNQKNLTLTGDGDAVGTGNGQANKISGNSGDNVLIGNAGKDQLFGNAGADHLIGGTGNDKLSGGAGSDMLSGGSGADVFLFEIGNRRHVDTITDFTRADTIDLSSIDASSLKDGNQAFRFIGDKAFTGTAGELKLSKYGFQADTNGNGVFDLYVKVFSDHDLTKSDFIL